MVYKYASAYNKETDARALIANEPISTKQTIEICNFIRGRTTADAKKVLERVVAKKQAIPMKRFNRDTGHKPGKIAAGRYPKNASNKIIDLIKLAEANAQYKGLGNNLIIKSIVSNQASRPIRGGRRHGLEARRTTIEIVVQENKSVEKKLEEKVKPKQEKIQEKKPEPKKEEKKKEEKSEDKK